MTGHRIKRLNDIIKKENADAALITSPENLFYFSGFTGGEGCLLVSERDCLLITDSRYTLQAKIEAVDFEILTYSGSLADFVGRTARDMKIKKLLFEDQSLTYAEFERYENALSAKLYPLFDALTSLRSVKDESEARLIYNAVRLADDAFQYALDFIRAGVTEAEVAAHIEGYMRRMGAQRTSFDTIVASGARSAMPHGVASQKEIRRGDFVTMDFGCVLDGYCSDMTRTVVVGRASSRQKEIYNTVLYAQSLAEKSIVQGMAACELDRVARKTIEDFGFGENFGHSLGHGVGIQIHERPAVSPKSRDILAPGSVITIEPGIYIEGFGGVRIEDMVYVTEEGYSILTSSPKELLVI